MKETRYVERFTNPAVASLEEIPVMDYSSFMAFTDLLMGEEGTHCLAYFVLPVAGTCRFLCCMAADENHAMLIYSHEQPALPGLTLASITARHFQFHIFEREIHEQFGIVFEGHPWMKPVRFPADRHNPLQGMDQYPFYSIEGEELHEVGVGPVHAGVIEPGHFRFICHGEKVLHLEIHLGYQHRGVEKLFLGKQDLIQRSVLAESIAGDTATGHALAFAGVMEALAGFDPGAGLSAQRTIALELERIAMHIGDTAALCNDVAYQMGQVTCEALRTLVINTTQLWCGNRFGKGLIRPGGSHYPLTESLATVVRDNLREVERRYRQITDRIFSLPSVLGRFEGTGRVTAMQASLIGAVGMAARSSGMHRDVRWSHPFAGFTAQPYEPVVLNKGDVWARAMLRKQEVEQSIGIIRKLFEQFTIYDVRCTNEETAHRKTEIVNLKSTVRPSSLAISLVEGWRGEICHVAVTDEEGELKAYKPKDPSLHNWMALALAVRNEEISDFPLCNKSFNLSYCGYDL